VRLLDLGEFAALVRAGQGAASALIPLVAQQFHLKDRPESDPLAPATLERIKAGIRRWWLPLLTPAGGTWRDQALPLHWPMPTRTTRESDAVAVPPLLVPIEGRPGKVAIPATAPARTQTGRAETAIATPMLPFLTPLRGGGDKHRARLKYHLSMLVVEHLNGGPVRHPQQLKRLAFNDAEPNEMPQLFGKLKAWSEAYLAVEKTTLERAAKTQRFTDYLLENAARDRSIAAARDGEGT